MRQRMVLTSLLNPFFVLFLFFLVACNSEEKSAEINDRNPQARLIAEHAIEPMPSHSLLKVEVDSAVALQRKRQYRAALDLLQKAIEREASHPLAATDTVLAMAYHKAGISYYRLDEYTTAIVYFDKALGIREAVFTPDHPDIIRGYNNIGNVYLLVDHKEKALEYLLQSLSLQSEPPIDPYAATIRALGRIYEDMNDAYRAGKYLELALEAYQRFDADAPWNIASAYTDLAHFYLNEESYEASLDASQQSLNIRMPFPEKYREDSIGIAVAYTNISYAYEKLGRLDSAMFYQKKSLQWNRRLYAPSEPILAKNYNNLGYLHLMQGNHQLAEKELSKAINLNTQNSDYAKLSDNLENLGRLYFTQQNYDQALKLYQRALSQLVPQLSATDLQAIPTAESVTVEHLKVMENLSLKGETLYAQFERTAQIGNLQLALQHFDALNQVADRLRYSYLADDSKINLARQVKPYFEEAIKVSLRLFEETGEQIYAEHAFSFAEKSKAIVLLEALKETRAKQFAGLKEADLEQEQELKQQIAQLETNIYQGQQQNVGKEQIQEWKRTLITTYQTYEQLVVTLEEQSPDYYRLKYDNQVLGVKDIQNHRRMLTAGQTLLEFFVGDDIIYAFEVSQSDFRVHTLPIDFSLSATIDTFRQSINNFIHDPENTLPVYSSLGQGLYQQLWAPLAGNLPQNVIIIPDDVLGLLPFEALLAKQVDTSQLLKDWPYLIKEHQICYNYSATLLHETLERPAIRQTANEILAFAPSFEQRIKKTPPSALKNPIAGNSRAVNTRQGLQPLFFNEQEVESIGEIVTTRIYTGAEANKKQFQKLAPHYRFLHIATHGLADDEEPDYSFVAFSQPADTIILDEVLLVNELYNLQLNAEMVVLSACETGVGKIQRGEGIVSLARGFSYAGARSIITTLWNISDQRSNDLMRTFYQQLRSGQTKDRALREAKMQFVNHAGQLAHPYFWAGFIPLGDMQQVEIKRPGRWASIPGLPFALTLAVGSVGIWFWKKVV